MDSEGKLVLKLPNGKCISVSSVFQDKSSLVYLLVDCSGSMTGDKLKQAKKGALDFAKSAHMKGYYIGLIKFESDAACVCKPGSEIPILKNKIEELTVSGSTNMTEALKMAYRDLVTLCDSGNICAVVVVTDGAPDDPKSALDVAMKMKEKGIEILAVGTDDADQEFLSKLVSRRDLAVEVPKDRLAQGISSVARMLPDKSGGRL